MAVVPELPPQSTHVKDWNADRQQRYDVAIAGLLRHGTDTKPLTLTDVLFNECMTADTITAFVDRLRQYWMISVGRPLGQQRLRCRTRT